MRMWAKAWEHARARARPGMGAAGSSARVRDDHRRAEYHFRYPPVRTLDGVAGVSSIHIHRYGAEDMAAWRAAARRHGGTGTPDPPPHYFVIAHTINGYPHPVMLQLEPTRGGGFMATPLPRGTRHPFGQLLTESVQALRSEALRASGFASLAPPAPPRA